MQQKFDRWFKRMGVLIWAAAGGIIVAIFRPLIDSVWPRLWSWIIESPAHREATVQFIQAGVITVLYGLIFRDDPYFPTGAQEVRKGTDYISPSDAAESFYWWWHNWWPLLIALYILLGARALFGQLHEHIWNLGVSLLINVSSFFILFCYLALLGWESRRKLRKVRSLFFWVFVLITGLNLLSAYFYDLTHWPQILFMIGSGLANGVAFALLIGRFESKYLGTPQWVLVLLYIYAVMQATYGLFNTDLLRSINVAHTFRTTISILVLFLKIVLYGWVSWMMREGRLTVYLESISSLAKQVEEKWAEVKLRGRASAATAGQ